MSNQAPHTDTVDDQLAGAGSAGGGEVAIATRGGMVFEDRPLSLGQKIEAWISRISTKNNFWHRLCSWIWLPLAYRSGIKMTKRQGEGDESAFTAVLPFKRFNKNWYNAMAGAALLGNAEVAGGMYVFNRCGGEYTVVCKKMEYKFLRPCLGPAMYRSTPREDVEELVEDGGEFNITLDIEIVQLMRKPNEKERRVGKAAATFHVTPKALIRARLERRKNRGNG